jgi:serine/threonine protein kinase
MKTGVKLFGCNVFPDRDKEGMCGNGNGVKVECVVGCGAFGVVWKLKDKDTVVKFQPFDCETERKMVIRELVISHILNGLDGDDETTTTKVFTKTHGWFFLKHIPIYWFFSLTERDRAVSNHLQTMLKTNNLFICTFMDFNIISLNALPMDIFHIKASWFILIHAFWVLRKKYPNAAHRDIHPGNIMFHPVTGQQTQPRRRYGKYVLSDILYWEPRLIDFGRAILEKGAETPTTFKNEQFSYFTDDEHIYEPSNDMFRIAHCLQKKAESHKDIEKFAKRVKKNVIKHKMYGRGHRQLEKLLNHSFFDDVRVCLETSEEIHSFKKIKL